MLEHGEEYGVDPQKVCMAGISGGGWIAVGAANLMAKAGDISKVKALFIHTGMLSNETAHFKREELTEYERDWGNQDLVMTSIYKLHATDFDKQINDDQLYPGKASDELLMMYPPTCIWTSEFDFLRRDNELFANRLRKVGKLVDISLMPGTMHGYQLMNYGSAETK